MDDPRKHPSFHQVKLFILGEAASDYQGLWEPLWDFRGDLATFVPLPELTEDERQLWAETALRDLHEDGLITFLRSAWEDGDRHGDAENEAVRLDSGEVEAALASDHWRTVPIGDASICFIATDKGERTWQSSRPLSGMFRRD